MEPIHYNYCAKEKIKSKIALRVIIRGLVRIKNELDVREKVANNAINAMCIAN